MANEYLNSNAKRSLDVFGAALLGIGFSVPTLMSALAIKRGEGSAFYRCERLGKNSLPFVMLKLRTMVPDADKNVPKFSHAGDPHVTRAGRILRKLSLDETPQFLNVLKGDMSLVGPRPVTQFRLEVMSMQGNIFDEWQEQVLTVEPGLTGPGQFILKDNAFHSPDVQEQRMRADMDYVENATLDSDIRILFQTPRRMIGASEVNPIIDLVHEYIEADRAA